VEYDSRGRGVRPVVLKRRIVPTGEPCNTETVPHGSVGGRGKRSKLPRPRPTQSRSSLPLPVAAQDWRCYDFRCQELNKDAR
jgi:hypothetical protein